MQHLALLALAASTAHGFLATKRQQSPDAAPTGTVEEQNAAYLTNICIPSDPDTGLPTADTPCMAISALYYQCVYDVDVYSNITAAKPKHRRQTSDDDEPVEQSPSAQRTCICESQFFDQVTGCMDCYKAHGGIENIDYVPPASFIAVSSSYCAASSTPTQDFEHYFGGLVGMSASAASADATATPVSDPIGNKTDVSLYFTPSVSYPAVLSVAQPTVPSNGNSTVVSYASSNVVSGQIVPTAAAGQSSGGGATAAATTGSVAQTSGVKASGSASGASASASGSSSATSSAGAMETAAVKVGAVGVLGMAAVVAML